MVHIPLILGDHYMSKSIRNAPTLSLQKEAICGKTYEEEEELCNKSKRCNQRFVQTYLV